MIFYFTGTGNSLWVAKELSAALDEQPVAVADELNRNGYPSYLLKPDETVCFVFPIHSWGIPVIMTDFINKVKLENYNGQPVYAVCTCGDDCGLAGKQLSRQLLSKGITLRQCFSVTMPNNYILFPGFDVDGTDTEKKKLANAADTLKEIIAVIRNKTNKEIYTTGTIPFIKSRIIQPLFVKFALGKNSFYSTERCISCGLCEKVCPTGTIRMDENHPVWSDTCIQCLACIHRCPVIAIEYGKASKHKGRYVHPGLK